MKTEIITVGTEILMGQILNTNARDLARELLKLGAGVYYQTVVGDNRGRLEEAFSCALSRADLVILSGGLGPTEDDLTRETVARVLGLPLERCPGWEKRLEKLFRRRGRPMVESNLKQALVPRGGKLLPNDRGTAPGIYLEKEDKIIVLLPGPPGELQHIFNHHVLPLLKEKLASSGQLGVLKSKVLRLVGLGESAMEEMIRPLIEKQDNPTVAPLAKRAEVHLRITAKADTPAEADKLISAKRLEIESILGEYIYGEDEETLEHAVSSLLRSKGKTLALAESCSGGLMCHRLTNIPGSSDFLLLGVVSYSNEAKINMLGVSKDILDEKGAVSKEVALMMANGARQKSKADLGVGITGIAGPGGATPGKPVGLTYLALVAPDLEYCRRHEFYGSREEIKERATQTALNLLRLYLLGKLKQT